VPSTRQAEDRGVREWPPEGLDDTALIMRTLFEINAKLVDIHDEVRVVRWLLEEDDGEEEGNSPEGDDP
jgi:hypothetical protein